MKVLIAGVLGGLLVFCWSAVSHMVLPLGEMGIEQSGGPNEAAVLEALKNDLPASGLYMLPTADPSITDPKEQMENAMAKWAAGPSAVINYRAEGMSAMGPQTLGKEAAANVLAAIIAAMVLAACKCGYVGRVFLVLLLGVFAWLNVEVSYWIWYSFPRDYMLAQGADHAAGWLIAGIVMAAIIRPTRGLGMDDMP